MPPKQSNPDSRALTLLFKKHKTTVLLTLQPHESLDIAKEKLLHALKARGVNDINGDSLPDDSFDIEFGEPVDRADLEKGWKRLQAETPDLGMEGASRKSKGKSKNEPVSLLEAGLDNGYPIAFRFCKPTSGQDTMDLDGEDPGWDIIMPSFEDDEQEEAE